MGKMEFLFGMFWYVAVFHTGMGSTNSISEAASSVEI